MHLAILGLMDRSWSAVTECGDGVDELGAGLAQASGQVVTIGVVDPPVKASSASSGSARLSASASSPGSRSEPAKRTSRLSLK